MFVLHTSCDRCREVIHGTEPVIRYHYAVSGNYTLRLKVGARVAKVMPPVTGVYSQDLQVLGLHVCFHNSNTKVNMLLQGPWLGQLTRK